MDTPEPSVNYTVKELLAQADAKADDRHNAVMSRIDELEQRVEVIAAAGRVNAALDKRTKQEQRAAWSQKDRVVAALGVGVALLLGVANLALSH